MKRMINRVLGVLLIAIIAVPLYGMKKTATKKTEAPIEHVTKEVSLLDQIVEQAEAVIKATNKKSRSTARVELSKLIAKLDTKIKDAINDDIKIIQFQSSENALQQAYDHLLDVVAQIDAQANVVEVTEQATELIKNASEEEKPGIIALAYQKIQEAAQIAKSMVTTPVNYVFGEESSNAKTAFYATIGALMLYGAYQYGFTEPAELSRQRLLKVEQYNKFLDKIDEAKKQQESILNNLSFISEKSKSGNLVHLTTEGAKEYDKLEELINDLKKEANKYSSAGVKFIVK